MKKIKAKDLLYTELAKYYDQIVEPHVDTKKELEFLEEIFEKYNINKVLDIGCGTGRHVIPLAKEGYNVTGLDCHKEILEIAKKKAREADVSPSFIRKDIKELGVEARFDAAICMWSTFYYLPQPETVKVTYEALEPGGLFIISGKDSGEVDKTSEIKEETIELDGEKVKKIVEEKYEGKKRIRKYHYQFENREYIDVDVCNMYSLEEVKKILKSSGFKIEGLYTNWSFTEYRDEKHFQLIAKC